MIASDISNIRDDMAAPWRNHAACHGWWDLMDDPSSPDEAKGICRYCRVIQDCGTWVFSLDRRDDPDGTVAGMSKTQRNNLRRRINRKKPARPRRAVDSDDVKQCRGCLEIKPATAFYKKAGTRDGLTAICKHCQEARRRARGAA